MSSSLKRSNAQKHSRQGSRCPSSSFTSPNLTNTFPSEAQSAESTRSPWQMASRHTPNTTATVGTFSEMIPADHWELREREKAVCHNDFTSGEDHGPTRGSEAILNAWRLNKETHLTRLHDDSLAAGTAFHIGGAALESPLHNWNTDMRHTLILVHQLRRAMEDEPDSERATRLKSVIDDFESRYDGFATHLRAPSQDGEPTEEWMRIHAERTLELRTSVGQMVPWLPRIPTNTGTAPQSLQPSVTFTAATGNPHPLRLETGQGAAGTTDSTEWRPSPMSEDGSHGVESHPPSPRGGRHEI